MTPDFAHMTIADALSALVAAVRRDQGARNDHDALIPEQDTEWPPTGLMWGVRWTVADEDNPKSPVIVLSWRLYSDEHTGVCIGLIRKSGVCKNYIASLHGERLVPLRILPLHDCARALVDAVKGAT